MIKLFIIVTLVSSYGFSSCFDSTIRSYQHNTKFNKATKWIMKDSGLKNLSFLIGDKDGIRYVKHFGEESNDDSIYDISSVTKLFTATATMQVLEKSEKFSVWSPLRDILPQRYSRHLKLDHLFRHRSGFPAGLYGRLRSEEGLLKVKPYASPRGNFKYSDVNYMLLSKVVENISGYSFEEYLKRNIFDSLDLNRTLFNPLNDHRVLPSILGKEAGIVHDPVARKFGGVSGHAGVFSNIIDLAKFSSIFLNKGKYCNKKILTEYSVTKMTTATKYSARGLGFDVHSGYSHKPRARFFTYKKSFGHTGFAGASLWIDKKKNLFAIFLGNATYSKQPYKSKKGFYRSVIYLTKKIDRILGAQNINTLIPLDIKKTHFEIKAPSIQ